MTRAETLARATDATLELWRPAERLLARQLEREPGALRLVGVGVSGIERESTRQLGLFDEPDRARARKVDAVVDAVSDRFGAEAIGRGRSPRIER